MPKSAVLTFQAKQKNYTKIFRIRQNLKAQTKKLMMNSGVLEI